MRPLPPLASSFTKVTLLVEVLVVATSFEFFLPSLYINFLGEFVEADAVFKIETSYFRVELMVNAADFCLLLS